MQVRCPDTLHSQYAHRWLTLFLPFLCAQSGVPSDRRSVVLIAEIDHVLEACGRGGVSGIVHEICFHSIPFPRWFLSQCLLSCL